MMFKFHVTSQKLLHRTLVAPLTSWTSVCHIKFFWHLWVPASVRKKYASKHTSDVDDFTLFSELQNDGHKVRVENWNKKTLTFIIHCVSKKRHPFYFCKNLAKYYPISIIFGSHIPEEICNKSMHVYPPHLFTVLIPYLVKIMIHLPVFTLF